MAIFKKTAELRKDEMIEKLKAKAILSGDDMVAARREVVAMADKAISEYLAAADKLRKDLKAEIDKRVERWTHLEEDREEIRKACKDAEAKLGAAMVAGHAVAEAEAENEIARLRGEISKIDDRIRIFKEATFSISGAEGIKAVEAKEAAMQETIRTCNEILDEIDKAVTKHIRGFSDNMTRFYTGYPSNIAGSVTPLVDINFPEGLRLETLQRMTSDDLTIDDLLQM